MQKITPFLWFDNQLEEAANLYVSIFKNSKILDMQKMPDGKVMTGSFILDGQEFRGMNAGPEFKFTEAISIFVDCEDQAEVDEYWNKLIANGGEESQCGWLKDKFGLSWQIIPKQLMQLMADPNPAKAQAVMQCMLGQKKIIVEELQKAYDAA